MPITLNKPLQRNLPPTEDYSISRDRCSIKNAFVYQIRLLIVFMILEICLCMTPKLVKIRDDIRLASTGNFPKNKRCSVLRILRPSLIDHIECMSFWAKMCHVTVVCLCVCVCVLLPFYTLMHAF